MSTASPSREYSMADLARLLGVTRSWVQTREKNGMIPQPRRTPGGHRTYNSEELHLIRQLAEETGLKIPDEPPIQKVVKPVSGTIALINQKGGVGKTTVTQNLGLALANKGFKCLLVDLDRQFNLTTCFGVNIQEEPQKGLAYILDQAISGKDVESLIQENVYRDTGHPHVHLIPNNLQMFDVEVKMVSGRTILSAVNTLRRALKSLESEYNFILIDCPPDLGMLTMNGIRAANAVIIPVDHELSLQGIKQLDKTLEEVAVNYEEVPILGVLINKHCAKTNINQYLAEKVEHNFPELQFRTKISQTVRILESHVERKPLVAYEPKHAVSKQFSDLADEFVERMWNLSRGGGNGA